MNINNKHVTAQANINALFIRGGAVTALKASPSHLVTTLVPKIGVLTSTLLYFSPFASVKQAQSTNDAGSLNPIPLTIMAVSSLCWLVYGLSIQDPYVTLSNVPGCIASIWYVVTILPLLKGTSSLKPTQNLVVLLSATTINLWTYMSLSKKSMSQISHLLGLYASLLFIVLSGSPLSTIKTVVASKNSESILAPLTVAQVVNKALWSMYGAAIGDRFVWGPNAVGLGFGLVQLLLKGIFPAV
jgi:solute carrier family 50 protein (sugar transporter)